VRTNVLLGATVGAALVTVAIAAFLVDWKSSSRGRVRGAL
jgi:hypothetical protein